MTNRKKIITASSAAALLVLIGAILYTGGNYLLNYALAPIESVTFTSDDNWLNSRAQIIETTSFDGLNLKAYEAKPAENSHKYGIFMHGYRNDPLKMSDFAMHFYKKGWNVILPGQRGHGWSQGNCIDMGIFAGKDVVQWTNVILEQDPQAQIMLFGVSMGAATVMIAAGQHLPANVKCAVEDCGYSSVWEQFKYRMREEFHIPAFPLLNIASSISKHRYGFNFTDVSPEKEIHNSSTPMLFIHGTADDYVPYAMLAAVFNSAICEKEKLSVPEAVHAKAMYTEPELYWSTVDRFVEKYIK